MKEEVNTHRSPEAGGMAHQAIREPMGEDQGQSGGFLSRERAEDGPEPLLGFLCEGVGEAG